LKTFLEFQTELTSGKLRNVYFISAVDGYFVAKAGELLREKIFGSRDLKDNFFLKYADETPMQELIDLASNFASLFSSQKIIILKRCEKYSRKLSEFMKFASNPDKDTFLLLVFDRDFVAEKKLAKDEDFYDFSEMPQRNLYDWVKGEFESKGLSIKKDALELFLENAPQSFDLLDSEISKISNYDFGENEPIVTRQLILEFTGYDPSSSPDELMLSILDKHQDKALAILDNLLNSKGVNEVYLLSIISTYYMDIMIFKSRDAAKLDSRSLYSKYKIWGERGSFARDHAKLLEINALNKCMEYLTETDKKLKTSMLNPKILMTSLVEQLINA
jgi:DNA polymerase III delta subunit